MSYAIAGYIVTLGALGAYALRLTVRRRRLTPPLAPPSPSRPPT